MDCCGGAAEPARRFEAKKHFVSVATTRAGVWMRPERQQEVQVLAKQARFSESKLQPQAAPPLMRFSSALVLPILSLPLTLREESQLPFEPQQLLFDCICSTTR
jgi:hypothetical protein